MDRSDASPLAPDDDDDSAEAQADPTLLSPVLRPDVLGTPDQRQQRLAIAGALFGVAVSIGRYRLLNRLGEGGMGTVYAAFDDRLDRKIAIKLLRTSRLDGAEARERTLREARALARLSHPNVVHVYEVGEYDDQLFVAMEFLAGPTLRAWLDDAQPRTWNERLAVMLQAGRGLAAAHAEGIIHRDFKPHNAMFGADGRVRVLDFGLASLGEGEVDHTGDSADPSESVGGRLTKTGALLGTPAYMAPEQFESARADARSDQFAFCVALHEALYGERPFEGRTFFELRRAVEGGRIKTAKPGSPVPTWLRKVVLRGLAHDPAERFESMQALLDALVDDPAVRRRKWWSAAAVVGLLGASAGAQLWMDPQQPAEDRACMGMEAQLEGVWDDTRRAEVKTAIEATELGYASATWERVEQRLDEYTQQWVAARVEACEATDQGRQSSDLLDLRMACLDERLLHVRATVDVLAQADATVVMDAVQAVARLPDLDRCADVNALTAEIPPPEDDEVAKRVAALDEQLVKAKALQHTGQYAKGVELASTIAKQAVEIGYEPLMARAWLRQGDLQRLAGDYEGAVTTLEQAHETAVGLQMADEAASSSSILVFVLGFDLDRHAEARSWAKHAKPWSRAAGTPEARASYHNNVGTAVHSEGKDEEAREHHEQALAILEALNPEDPGVGTALNSLGNAAKGQGKYQEAYDYYARALAIWKKALGPEHPTVAKCIANLGSAAHAKGDYAEAYQHLHESVAIYERSLGPEHPDITLPLTTLGELAWREGKYEDSRRYQERALAIKEKTLGPDNVSVAVSLGILGMLARKEGKYDEARGHLQRAQAILEKALGPEHKRIAICLNSLGNLATDEGKYDEAREYFERALEIWEKTQGPEHSDVGIALVNLGNIALQTEQYEQARQHFERALAISEKWMAPDHPDLAYHLHGLGESLLGLGRPAEALPLLERALTLQTAKAGDPVELANTRFSLAKALWDAPANKGRDRDRALESAELARAAQAEAGERSARELDEVTTWLARRK
jgi:tetratricopeptide (TPR) repeat protein/tRNA A-37 threonylcarbamoyl transferase component Bud32